MLIFDFIKIYLNVIKRNNIMKYEQTYRCKCFFLSYMTVKTEKNVSGGEKINEFSTR